MKITEAIASLEKHIRNPMQGLPEEAYLFVRRLTPMVNVDLLIKDEIGQTLLSWREHHSGIGWHIPGGIIRYKEEINTRIQKVIETEIENLPVQFDPTPIAINEIMCKHATCKGHSISLLIKCFLSSKHKLKNKGLKQKDPGFLKWFKSSPSNLIGVHDIYKAYL